MNNVLNRTTSMKLVIDASTLIAAGSGHAQAHALVRALRLNSFEAPASVPLLLYCEAAIMAASPKGAAGQGPAATRAFARNLAALCQPVHLNALWRPQCRDPVDDLLLATAHAADAQFIVSLRDATRMTAQASRLGVHVITPEQALQALQGNLQLEQLA